MSAHMSKQVTAWESLLFRHCVYNLGLALSSPPAAQVCPLDSAPQAPWLSQSIQGPFVANHHQLCTQQSSSATLNEAVLPHDTKQFCDTKRSSSATLNDPTDCSNSQTAGLPHKLHSTWPQTQHNYGCLHARVHTCMDLHVHTQMYMCEQENGAEGGIPCCSHDGLAD